ncbi:hypothetical protein ACNO8X_14975 [Mycobacterium sp. PDNC021]|uniref:hypothetical protein n=1 Tax=Mycobacterium sp. PDNC021 TaxID=3391399 RepID=UPI003AABA089
MVANQEVQPRTRGFARVLGPFYVVVGTVVAVRAADMRPMLSEFTSSNTWPWITGVFLLMGGIAVIAFHPYWRGAAAAIVSIVGWGMAAKGFFLLAFPHQYASLSSRLIGATPVWQFVYLLGALMGIYLTYVGWAKRPDPASQAPSGIQGLPRAA